jgi:hypothetical protein
MRGREQDLRGKELDALVESIEHVTAVLSYCDVRGWSSYMAAALSRKDYRDMLVARCLNPGDNWRRKFIRVARVCGYRVVWQQGTLKGLEAV